MATDAVESDISCIQWSKVGHAQNQITLGLTHRSHLATLFPPTSSPAQTHPQHKQLSVNVELPIGTTLDDVSVLLPFSGSACPRSLGLFFPLPPLRRSTTPGQRRKRYGNFKITDAVLLKKEEKSS